MNESQALRSFLRCNSFCTAGSYDLLALSHYFRKKGFLTRLLRVSCMLPILNVQAILSFLTMAVSFAGDLKRNLKIKSWKKCLRYSISNLIHILNQNAANPPNATTGDPTAIGSTQATVGATVNPKGEATTAYVEYGTSISWSPDGLAGPSGRR